MLRMLFGGRKSKRGNDRDINEFNRLYLELRSLEGRIKNNKGNGLQEFGDKCCYEHTLDLMKNNSQWKKRKKEINVLDIKI